MDLPCISMVIGWECCWPAAVDFIRREKLNEFFPGRHARVGIVTLGGLYNTTLRAMELLGCATTFGDVDVPLYVLNVAYPLMEQEFIEFCTGKDAILLIEEGQPDYIESSVETLDLLQFCCIQSEDRLMMDQSI